MGKRRGNLSRQKMSLNLITFGRGPKPKRQEPIRENSKKEIQRCRQKVGLVGSLWVRKPNLGG